MTDATKGGASLRRPVMRERSCQNFCVSEILKVRPGSE